MLKVVMAGFRTSQIMKKVRVTKMAVIIEAMMPMIKVTDRGEDVVYRRGHGRAAEAPLEAVPQVEQHRDERQEDGEERGQASTPRPSGGSFPFG